MHRWSRRLTILPGASGVLIITLGLLIAAFPYVGDAGQSYSPFNHFVSELGDTRVSERAWLFNLTLFVGGLLYGLFMIGVGLRFTGLLRSGMTIGGALVGLSAALVGVFPMNENYPAHAGAALGFFEGSLVVLIGFALAAARARRPAYPRWLALVALPMTLCNIVFIALIVAGGEAALVAPTGGRDPFWLIPAAEWGVVVWLLVWVSVITIWRAARRD